MGRYLTAPIVRPSTTVRCAIMATTSASGTSVLSRIPLD
jgi:hypothetical protein